MMVTVCQAAIVCYAVNDVDSWEKENIKSQITHPHNININPLYIFLFKTRCLRTSQILIICILGFVVVYIFIRDFTKEVYNNINGCMYVPIFIVSIKYMVHCEDCKSRYYLAILIIGTRTLSLVEGSCFFIVLSRNGLSGQI